MNYVEQTYRDLVIQYLSGDCNPDETEKLISWIQSTDENFRYFIEIKDLWEAADIGDIPKDFDIDSSWKHFKKRLDVLDNKKSGKVIKMNPYSTIVKYASSIAAALVITFFAFNYFTPEPENIIQMVASGETSEDLLLADGTLVKLNHNSAIYFPEDFDGDQRNVKVKGEVYFDVKHNSEKPFIVDCGDVMVEVCGTEFDIQTNPDLKETIVIVTEGKVKVWEENNKENNIFIEKGESIKFEKSIQKFAAYEADRNFLSWKTRQLHFDNASLDVVLKTLENHFRIDIYSHSEVDLNLPLSTQFDDNTLQETLDVIAMIFDLGYSIDNNQVKIQNK